MTDYVGVAIIGCAHRPHAWSYAHALAASPNARLVGVFDTTPERGRSIGEEFAATYHDDASGLLESPDVQAAVVCSATAEHRGLVELAASRGCHVLCEKPIATTLDDAAAMIEACRRAGVQLHTAFVTRFLPLVQQVRAILLAGDLGDLIAMVGGNRGRPPLPPDYPDWITTRSLSGGGALIDHSVHITDLMRHLSGREVGQVGAEVGSLMWDIEVEDMALMSLVFDGGMVASVDPSWSVPAGNPWAYDFYLRIVGSSGSLSINDMAESLHLVSDQRGGGLRLVPFGEDVDAAMVEAFVASIRAGHILSPCADGEDGRRALEVALAGYEAAAAARIVSLQIDRAL